MLAAAKEGQLGALVLAGVELADLPVGAAEALRNVFVVQLEVRHTTTTELADVVLPVTPTAEELAPSSAGKAACGPLGRRSSPSSSPTVAS